MNKWQVTLNDLVKKIGQIELRTEKTPPKWPAKDQDMQPLERS